MIKFFPRPWFAGKNDKGHAYVDSATGPIVITAGVVDYERACLFAAAPELLEALIDLERTAGLAAGKDDPVRVKARAAIAKAGIHNAVS
jgi:hypothetical protein